MVKQPTFGSRLRWWRDHRGYSQLALSGRADVSQRHLGFLERGRTAPSRDMVLRLAEALDLPLREQNTLLLAAGYAPAWRESDLSAAALADVTRALDHMLEHQEPFPAVVVDRRWRLLRGNRAAVRMVEFLVGPLAGDAEVNLADALVAPDVLKPYLDNWPEVVRYFIRSVEADAIADGTAETAALLDRLLGYDGVRQVMQPAAGPPPTGPVLPLHFRKGDTAFQLFTTIATLGTPQDITLQELRIEAFFPMNDESRALLTGWAEG